MELSHCAKCKIQPSKKICSNKEGGRHPSFCPTKSFTALIPEIKDKYKDPLLCDFARLAAKQEAECYANRRPGPYVIQPEKCRIEETVEFAKKLEAKRLGLAFCAGLAKEAAVLSEILESHGFQVASVICSVGGLPKETLGIKEDEKVNIGSWEPMCNPLMQAEVLNRSETDLNIMLGLCVGHDSIFMKRSEAFCTVLAVKDRVTGHNPLAPLYNVHCYYKKLKEHDFAR